MDADPRAAATLISVLIAEQPRLLAFIDLLKREQDLLKRGDAEQLMPLAKEKSSHAEALAKLADQRRDALRHLGFTPDRAGIEAWLTRSKDEEATAHWDTVLQLATEANHLNSLNGKLISLHMQHNQQALSLLSGASDRVATTYGADGMQKSTIGGRILGSA